MENKSKDYFSLIKLTQLKFWDDKACMYLGLNFFYNPKKMLNQNIKSIIC